MKKIITTLVGFFLLWVSSAGAVPMTFDFSGITDDTQAQGSATMVIDIDGKTLTATLDNTSPLFSLTDPAYLIAPGITGFGFDLNPTSLAITTWSLTANTTNGDTVILGDNDSTTDNSTTPADDASWILNTTIASVDLDYLPTTSGSNIQGALYNPSAVGSAALAALPNYFTTASLIMEFDQDIILSLNLESVAGGNDPSPFVRMQNVGNGSENSLKLPGTLVPPTDPPGAAVPEPATMFLLGTGLVGLAGMSRKKYRK